MCMMKDYFEIGKIVNTVGISGEVKVFPTTDDVRRFDLLDEISILLNGSMLTKKVKNRRYHKNLVMLKLEGVEDVDSAEKFRGGIIVIDRSDALPLADNEYYISDLIGLTVETEDGRLLGLIKDVLVTGANDVYIVKREDAKDLLIPAIAECILKVDIEKKHMLVHLLEGLES